MYKSVEVVKEKFDTGCQPCIHDKIQLIFKKKLIRLLFNEDLN